jgi:hypothetical protein
MEEPVEFLEDVIAPGLLGRLAGDYVQFQFRKVAVAFPKSLADQPLEPVPLGRGAVTA